MPASLERIDLVVELVGRRFEERFACPCEPNSETTFSWDGKDASGRPLEGAQPVTVRVGYVYRGWASEATADRPNPLARCAWVAFCAVCLPWGPPRCHLRARR
ncbi:hypothetical protein ACSRUE_06500 [Sorangium sp. KYC3313]|uniref:hypothetical protein n=1 Tax=Sorangium sp. KYC3313 TaxID=3449740 RepID=UPI003F887F1F